ncbi:MAG: ATP-grasp domain-containing protein [Promethearchaeota archaeon]
MASKHHQYLHIPYGWFDLLELKSIFICEYICGGGLREGDDIWGLFCEGFAMLHGLAEDLLSAGLEVTVILDRKLGDFREWFRGCRVVMVESRQVFEDKFNSCVRATDGTYLIAPEFGRILLDLSRRVVELGKILCSPSPRFVEAFTYKSETNRLLEAAGFLVPRWVLLDLGASDPRELAREVEGELQFPVVVKPNDGAGSDNTFLVNNSGNLLEFLESRAGEGLGGFKEGTIIPGNDGEITGVTPGWQWIAQEFADGRLLSASVTARDGRIRWMAVNAQSTTIPEFGTDGKPHYEGGWTPVDFPIPAEFVGNLERLLGEVGDTGGYFGVDFVASGGKCLILEINPRLTTSYIGLRRVVGFNLGLEALAYPLSVKKPRRPHAMRAKNPVQTTSANSEGKGFAFGRMGCLVERAPVKEWNSEKFRAEFPGVLTPLPRKSGPFPREVMVCIPIVDPGNTQEGFSQLAKRLRRYFSTKGGTLEFISS